MTRPWTPTLMIKEAPCTAHSRAVWPNESWWRRSPAVASAALAAIFMVDAPVRISTPGHSMSGADGVGECGCVTPGVAPVNKLVKRLVNEGELSDDPTLEASEQPDSMAALTISSPARHPPRSRSEFPGPIEITRLFPTTRHLRRLIPTNSWRPQGCRRRLKVVLEAGEKQMILPNPIDTKVLAGKTLALETCFLQKSDRGNIGRDTCSFDPMKLQRPEREGNDGVDCNRHMTLARVSCPHPITETARLGTASTNIGERQPAQQNIIVLAENEEGIGEVAALVFGIALDATAKRGAGKVIGGPGRLPGREEIAACFPQSHPFRAVGHLRRPQHDAVAGNRRHRIGQADGAKECHGDQPSDGRQIDHGERTSSAVLRGPSSDSRGPAGKTVGDRGSSFKSGPRTKRGDRRPSPRNQCAAGGTGTLDCYRFNFLDQLVEWNRAAPIEQLTRELLGTRG